METLDENKVTRYSRYSIDNLFNELFQAMVKLTDRVIAPKEANEISKEIGIEIEIRKRTLQAAVFIQGELNDEIKKRDTKTE